MINTATKSSTEYAQTSSLLTKYHSLDKSSHKEVLRLSSFLQKC